jgi:hypothetical protein
MSFVDDMYDFVDGCSGFRMNTLVSLLTSSTLLLLLLLLWCTQSVLSLRILSVSIDRSCAKWFAASKDGDRINTMLDIFKMIDLNNGMSYDTPYLNLLLFD